MYLSVGERLKRVFAIVLERMGEFSVSEFFELLVLSADNDVGLSQLFDHEVQIGIFFFQGRNTSVFLTLHL